jgi:hypothetical protein
LTIAASSPTTSQQNATYNRQPMRYVRAVLKSSERLCGCPATCRASFCAIGGTLTFATHRVARLSECPPLGASFRPKDPQLSISFPVHHRHTLPNRSIGMQSHAAVAGNHSTYSSGMDSWIDDLQSRINLRAC